MPSECLGSSLSFKVLSYCVDLLSSGVPAFDRIVYAVGMTCWVVRVFYSTISTSSTTLCSLGCELWRTVFLLPRRSSLTETIWQAITGILSCYSSTGAISDSLLAVTVPGSSSIILRTASSYLPFGKMIVRYLPTAIPPSVFFDSSDKAFNWSNFEVSLSTSFSIKSLGSSDSYNSIFISNSVAFSAS